MKKDLRKLVNAKQEEHLTDIFIGIQGLLILFMIWFVAEFLVFMILLSAWIGHLIFFTGFIIKNRPLRKHRKKAIGLILIALCVIFTFSFIFQTIIKANRTAFEPNLGLDSNLGNPHTQGILYVEIDYSSDLKNDIPWFSLLYFGKEAFNRIGSQVIFIIDDPIPEVSVRLSSSNMSEFASLMNRTRDYPQALHCLILHNGSVEGISYFMGYAPKNPYWSEGMANYSEPKFTGCLVFMDEIDKGIDPWENLLQFVKTTLHEIGHYLNADHSEFGIMKQGGIQSFLELFYSIESQAQMNLYNKWSVEKGFFIYQ